MLAWTNYGIKNDDDDDEFNLFGGFIDLVYMVDSISSRLVLVVTT